MTVGPLGLVEVTCRYCNGKGWFTGAKPKGEKPLPDVRCGQCIGHGVVFRFDEAYGAKQPQVMAGQTTLDEAEVE